MLYYVVMMRPAQVPDSQHAFEVLDDNDKLEFIEVTMTELAAFSNFHSQKFLGTKGIPDDWMSMPATAKRNFSPEHIDDAMVKMTAFSLLASHLINDGCLTLWKNRPAAQAPETPTHYNM